MLILGPKGLTTEIALIFFVQTMNVPTIQWFNGCMDKFT